jgi:hypothetical protein
MKSFIVPGIEEYKSSLYILTRDEIKVLKCLASFPHASATSKELANALGYKSYHAANRMIGKIGKIIAEDMKLDLPYYHNERGTRPGFYLVIGDYLEDTGWNMWPQLRQALAQYVQEEVVQAKMNPEEIC